MNNIYGIVKPSLIDPSRDIEIWYHYRPSRSSEDTSFDSFKEIEEPSSIFVNSKMETSLSDKRLPGMYNLKLPVSIFGKKGIYTVYIKPKETVFTIKDIGALAAYPDQKGIVIDMNEVDNSETIFATDNLVGYRIEYLDITGGSVLKRQEYYRLITSNNRCEPITQNLTSANTNSNGYRFNSSGSLSFLTVTPSTSPGFKSNAKPYIGSPNQRIIITNTKFDPIMIEIEIVEHDIETLSYISEGNVVRNLDNGRITYYNFEGEIYKQFEMYSVKDNYTARSVAEVKKDKSDNIDNSLNINNFD